jgi:hypothetical protein
MSLNFRWQQDIRDSWLSWSSPSQSKLMVRVCALIERIAAKRIETNQQQPTCGLCEMNLSALHHTVDRARAHPHKRCRFIYGEETNDLLARFAHASTLRSASAYDKYPLGFYSELCFLFHSFWLPFAGFHRRQPDAGSFGLSAYCLRQGSAVK